jgi:iron complex transport system substrate-binding protein
MMKKWCSLFLVTVLWICAGFLLFDNPDSKSPRPTEIPQRIVSASPNITETLFALGLEDRIVGVSSDSNFPKKAKTLT